MTSARPNCTYSACRAIRCLDSAGNCFYHQPWDAEVVSPLSRKPSRTHTASSYFPLNDALGVTKSRRHVYQPL